MSKHLRLVVVALNKFIFCQNPFHFSSSSKTSKLMIIIRNISWSLGLYVDTQEVIHSSCLVFYVLSSFLSSIIALFKPNQICVRDIFVWLEKDFNSCIWICKVINIHDLIGYIYMYICIYRLKRKRKCALFTCWFSEILNLEYIVLSCVVSYFSLFSYISNQYNYCFLNFFKTYGA